MWFHSKIYVVGWQGIMLNGWLEPNLYLFPSVEKKGACVFFQWMLSIVIWFHFTYTINCFGDFQIVTSSTGLEFCWIRAHRIYTSNVNLSPFLHNPGSISIFLVYWTAPAFRGMSCATILSWTPPELAMSQISASLIYEVTLNLIISSPSSVMLLHTVTVFPWSVQEPLYWALPLAHQSPLLLCWSFLGRTCDFTGKVLEKSSFQTHKCP